MLFHWQFIIRALVHHWDDKSAKLAAFKARYPECNGVVAIVMKLVAGIEAQGEGRGRLS